MEEYNLQNSSAELQIFLKKVQIRAHIISRLTSLFWTWKIKIGGEWGELPHAQWMISPSKQNIAYTGNTHITAMVRYSIIIRIDSLPFL